MPWDPPDLPDDEDAIVDRILDNLQDKLPGWLPYDGQPEVAIAQEFARQTAATNALAVDAIAVAVAGIGETVFGVKRSLATTATLGVDLQVTATGTVIPEGFMVTGTNPAGEAVSFQLLTAVTATGTTQHVTMHAVTAGTVGNGVPAGDLAIITATAAVISATAASTSTGGADDEDIDTYLGRLVNRLEVLRPGGVRGSDLAALARTVPGVGRAVGVDLYNALADEDDSERTATVFVVAADGTPVAAGVKADVYDVLEAAREPNFLIFVEDPTYTSIDVVYEVIADSDADTDQLADDIDAAVHAYLAPASWGSTTEDPDAWQALTTVRVFDLVATIGAVPGVASVVDVTINGGAGNVTMTGRAPLPSPVTVAGTVT